MLRLLVVGFLFLLASCAQKETKLFKEDVGKAAFKRLIRPDISKPLVIDKNTIVIDARNRFEYTMAHIPKSLNIDWKDFSAPRTAFKGLLADDLYFHSRRLARLGIAESSKVIVVDEGINGEGHAGRIAWTLTYMGVKNVQVAGTSYFRMGWTNSQNEKPYKNQKIWKPKRIESIWVKDEELQQRLRSKGYFSHQKEIPKSVKDQKTVVIDVRSDREYSKSKLEIGAINIEWKEFFNKNGRANKKLKSRLQGVGIALNQRIIVISNAGVRSAAVTMALLDLGFYRAGNFAGGYQVLSGLR